MPKKQKRSGFISFSIYLKDKTPQLRGKTMPEVTAYASPYWERLSKEQKAKWNAEAASLEMEDATKKYTTLGTSFAIIDATLSEADERKNRMIAETKDLVFKQSRESLERHPFFVIHVNYTYKINEKNTGKYYYAPCEIGIVRFSIKGGIEKRYHVFTCPKNFFYEGKVPLGLRREALEHCEKTHKLDIDGHPSKEKNYEKVFEDIVSFISVDGDKKLPILFTMPSDINHNMSKESIVTALERCAEAKGHTSEDYFRVYEFQYLLHDLLKFANPATPTISLLIDYIYKELYYISANSACSFHQEEGDTLRMCSAAIATRWVYAACDHLCKAFEIKPLDGRHIPHPDDNHFSLLEATEDFSQGAEALDPEWSTVQTHKKGYNGAKKVFKEETVADGWDIIGKKDEDSDDDEWNVIGKKDEPSSSDTRTRAHNDESQVNVTDDPEMWPSLASLTRGRGRGKRN